MNISPFDRLLEIMTKPLVVFIYFGIIILLYFYFDKSLATFFYLADLRHNLHGLSVITRIGLGVVYLPLFLFLGLIFRYIFVKPVWEARAWFLLLCITIPGVICFFLKLMLGRARPILFLSKKIYGFYGLKLDPNFWSMPSGHTTTIMSVILGLTIVFPRYFFAFISIGIIVALSRVFLGHHYLSDILFSTYLVLLELGLLLYILRRKSWLTPAWQPNVFLARK